MTNFQWDVLAVGLPVGAAIVSALLITHTSRRYTARVEAWRAEQERTENKLPGQFADAKDTLNRRISTLPAEEKVKILEPIRDAELHIMVAASRWDRKGWVDAHKSGIESAQKAVTALLAKTDAGKNGA